MASRISCPYLLVSLLVMGHEIEKASGWRSDLVRKNTIYSDLQPGQPVSAPDSLIFSIIIWG